MWYLLQAVIIIGVLSWNVRDHWTPNGYVAAVIAIAIAWAVTFAVSKVLDLRRR